MATLPNGDLSEDYLQPYYNKASFESSSIFPVFKKTMVADETPLRKPMLRLETSLETETEADQTVLPEEGKACIELVYRDNKVLSLTQTIGSRW